MAQPIPLTPPQGQSLLHIARITLNHAGLQQPAPQFQERDLDLPLRQYNACFVTLTHHHKLRGCIGHLTPLQPLYLAVAENTRAAALYDPRFQPVQSVDLDHLKIEISVLSPLQPLDTSSPDSILASLRIDLDGVVLHLGNHSTTFLPQVWRQIPDPASFLDHLAEKAGVPPSTWRQPGTRLSTYQVQIFSEPT